MSLPIGRTLAHYRITAAIGAGGMGEVYRATDTKLGRDVALKVLPAEMASSPERLERFRREARAVAALNHAHIVTIHSVEEAEGVHFLTMELVDGQPLDKLVAAGALSVERIVEVGAAIASALTAAHEKGIVHRDLKPANVVVAEGGGVKVLDFGLAKVQPLGESTSSELPTEAQTRDGVVMGTVPYMSPEQVSGRPVDHRTDVFSLGVVLYEMASGRRPFAGQSTAELASAILRDTPPAVTELRPELPVDLVRIIRRCLEKDKHQRFQTARDVANELRDMRRHPTPGSGSPAQPAPARSEASGAARLDEGFWVAVLPFKHRGTDPGLEALAEGLTEEIVAGLSRFSYLRVVTRSSSSQFVGDAVDVREIGKALGAAYVLEGSLRQAGSVLRVAVLLVDASTGAHLWSETFDRDVSGLNTFQAQDQIADWVVSTVADPYGVLARSMAAPTQSKRPEDLTPYEAVLRFFLYQQRVSPEDHRITRAALEHAVQLAPGSADAWAALAVVRLDEYRHDFDPRPGALDRALEAANRAVGADPSNQLAYSSLAQIHLFRGETGAFRAAADRALALNRRDGNTLADLGLRFGDTGDWARCLELTRAAMALNPHHPGWYRYGEFLDHYRRGEYGEALAVAQKINMPSYYAGPLALAASHAQLGNTGAARTSLRDLLQLQPDFARNGEAMLGKRLYTQPELVAHLMDGLRKAGLEVEEKRTAVAPPVPAPTSAPTSGATRADEGFWVAVLPFRHKGASADIAALAEGLTEEIVTGLSRFSYLRVIARSSTARFGSGALDVRAIGKEIGARYVMEGSLRQAGTRLRLAVQLVDATSGAHLWAENYERTFNADAVFELQDELAPRIVSTVADAHGILPRSLSEAVRSRDPGTLSAYEAVLRSFGYFERLTGEELAAAREGLDSALRKAASSGEAWAMLALLCVQDYAQGFNLQADALERGLSAARRAVELAPSNHMSHYGLAQALFFLKEFPSFRNAAERAVALNPMDGNALAFLGELLSYSGDCERGAALAARAKQLNPNHPGFYWFADFYNAYRQRDYRGALAAALKLNLPDHLGAHMMLAAAYGQLGEREAAKKAVRDLLKVRPDFASIARGLMRQWWTPEYVEHLIDGWRKAGLDVPSAEGSRQEGAAPTGPEPGAGVASRSSEAMRDAAVAIAVLPFSDMSPARDQEYLCEGMAEEIMNALTRLPGLRVIARTSAFRFRAEPDLRKVGEALGVDVVLQGSVRRADQRLRITAQLVDVADDSHIWSERFDREMTDVFAIQDEIADAIVKKLDVSLGTSEPSRRPTENVAAYEALVEARHFFSKHTPVAAERALVCLRRALSLDPDYPDALVLHAFYQFMMGYMFANPLEVLPQVKRLAGRALELDPHHGEAQSAVAVAAMWTDWDWLACERHHRRALELSPASARAHELYGLSSLLATGRLEEALAELDRAVELDPLSALYAGNRARVLTCMRKFAEAEEACRRGLALDPGQLLAQVELIHALTFQGRFQEAVAMGRKAIADNGPVKAPLNALALALALAGERDEAWRLLEGAGEAGRAAYRSPLTQGLVHAVGSEMDDAIECVKRAVDERDPLLFYLKVHPMFDALRADPRYPELLRRVNLDSGGQA